MRLISFKRSLLELVYHETKFLSVDMPLCANEKKKRDKLQVYIFYQPTLARAKSDLRSVLSWFSWCEIGLLFLQERLAYQGYR